MIFAPAIVQAQKNTRLPKAAAEQTLTPTPRADPRPSSIYFRRKPPPSGCVEDEIRRCDLPRGVMDILAPRPGTQR
jgi:hypothetical protein